MKLFHIILPAVLLSATFVSCRKDAAEVSKPDESGEAKKVYLQIDAPRAGTKSLEPTASGKKADLLSALIYFTDAETDPKIYSVKKIGATEEVTLEHLSAGVAFDDIPGAVRRVYVVGNYNSSDREGNAARFDAVPGQRLSDVKSVWLDLQQAVYPQLSDGTTNNHLLTLLDGAGALTAVQADPTGWEGAGNPGEDDFFVKVTVSPIHSRIELKNIEYSGVLSSFRFEGIYVDNYHPKVSLGLDRRSEAIYNGSEEKKYRYGDEEFAYGTYEVMYDRIDQAIAVSDGLGAYGPGGDQVWAYHLFGNQDAVPHLVVKLTDLTDQNGTNIGERYLRIKGYSDKDGSVTSFLRGKNYLIENLKFTDSDLSVTPDDDGITVWAQVVVEEWDTVVVTPEL